MRSYYPSEGAKKKYMSNRGSKTNRSKPASRTTAGDIFGLFIVLVFVVFVLISWILRFGMFPGVLIAGFIMYGFSSTLLLFYLFAAILTASALLLGFIPILGQGFYWLVFKDWILLGFQEGLEPNRLITLVVWSGLATSLWQSLSVILTLSWLPKRHSKHSNQNSTERKKPQQSSAEQKKPQQESIKQEPAQQSFAHASENLCLQHLPSIFTRWDESELQSLMFDYEDVEESSRHNSDFDLLKNSVERFERTIDSLEIYRNRLGRIRFEKEKPCMELIRRDAPRFVLSQGTYVTRLVYEVAFEQESRSAFIFRSARVEAVLIYWRNHTRLLCLSINEVAL